MSEFKNRIITISGEPASGKSTVISKLKEYYEKQGYTVHIFSVGHEFRKIAQEKGLTREEFNEYMAKRGRIDKLIDSTVAQRGKEINSKERLKDIYIFDSRLAFHNIPDSFSIRLTVDDNVAGRRVFGDNKRGKEDKYDSIDEAIQGTKSRKESEIERYLKRYGIDLHNNDNYNLVIDTSYSTVEDISQVIKDCLDFELQGIEHGKMAMSPKMPIPLQSEMSTLGKTNLVDINEAIEISKKQKFNYFLPIEVLMVDGMPYIYDGCHRNYSEGYNGKTLVLYKIIAKDDEIIPDNTRTARQYVKENLRVENLAQHEWLLDKKNEKGEVVDMFSYNNIYPGIYEKLIEEENIGFDR